MQPGRAARAGGQGGREPGRRHQSPKANDGSLQKFNIKRASQLSFQFNMNIIFIHLHFIRRAALLFIYIHHRNGFGRADTTKLNISMDVLREKSSEHSDDFTLYLYLFIYCSSLLGEYSLSSFSILS